MPPAGQPPAPDGVLVRRGRRGGRASALALRLLARLGQPVLSLAWAVSLAGNILFWTFLGWTRGRPMRWRLVARHVAETGLEGLALAGLFGFAIGLVLALQITSVLDIVNILPLLQQGLGTILTREMAPLMVGILVAARSGTSLTADLAAMRLNREIDALEGMGINPTRLLIAPVAMAFILAVPGLTVLLAGFALATVAVYLDLTRSIPPEPLLSSVLGSISLDDMGLALAKSVVFAIICFSVASAVGLSVRRSIGAGVTRAVVLSITIILLANAGLTLLFPF